MKIVTSRSAQKGNMLSAQKKTLSNEKKNGKESNTGKKLVQARLPFKILAGSTPPTAVGGCVHPANLEIPPKKRKLSYTEETENPKKIGKSDSKENLTIDKIETISDAAVATQDVITVDDEEDKDISQILSPKTPVTLKNKANKCASHSAGSSTTPKVLIKLPLSGKKKKRKSKGASCSLKLEASDSSDVEFVSDEQQNPTKKKKLSEGRAQNNDVVSQKESVISKDLTKAHEDLNKSTQGNGSPIKAQHKSNLELNIKKHISDDVTIFDEELSKSSAENKLIILKVGKADNTEDESNILNTSEKKTCRSEKKKSTNSKLSSEDDNANCIVNDLTCDQETPTKKKVFSRRSTRQSEADQKSEELSPELEIVSAKSNAAITSINNKSHGKSLTPKQRKLMERRKKTRDEKELKLQELKEEKERKLQEQREERERKMQEEKMLKQKERDERELQRKKEREEKDELKRREREEKEEQRRKEKEDKERKRLAEIEAKNEEKRKKDEAKEDERRKREDDRRRKELEKEEEETKKKKAAQAFTKFFVAKGTKTSAEDDQESREDPRSVDSLAFRPFQVKGDMKLAPLVRREFKERSREKLDSFLKSTQPDEAALYIDELKNGKYIPLRGLRTVLKDSDFDEVIIIEDELETAAQAIDEVRSKPIQKYKAKLYLFRENRRPPFFGTWRKKSTVITPRRPFATDKTFFDYEVDSDDEWEEEEPGESLNGSEDEKDESEDEDYEVDNEWFVPHGHLSDEELQNEDDIGPDTSREAQKAKLKALQHEFAQEMKKKTEKIKPRLIGTIWEDENGKRPNLCPIVIWDSLCVRAMMICERPLVDEPKTIEPEPTTPPPEKQKRLEINDELMGDLVRLVHGNRHSRVFLIKEYIEHVSNTCETIKNGECLTPTKSLIREKIDEISEWSVVDASSTKKKNKKKLCWVVSADILQKYSLGNLGLRNEWSYKLQPKFDTDKNEPSAANEIQEDSVKTKSSETVKSIEHVKKKPKLSGISKFAKVLTKEEKQTQLKASTSAAPSASPTEKSFNKITSPKVKTTPVEVKSQLTSSSSSNKTLLVKKRVPLLMSVPPGQEFSAQSKTALISNFLQKNKVTSSVEEKSLTPVSSVMNVEEIILSD